MDRVSSISKIVSAVLVFVACFTTMLDAKPTVRSDDGIRCRLVSDNDAVCTVRHPYTDTTDLVADYRCSYYDVGNVQDCADEPFSVRMEPKRNPTDLQADKEDIKLPMQMVRRGSRCWTGPGSKVVCAG